MVIPGPSFEPAGVLEAVEQERCTALYGVPTMFIAELGDPSFDDRDLSSLRTGSMAGSPDGDGWMHTGDLATMDDDGYVDVVGRIKDMVIRGGENVYPREVEEFLHGHPDIADVQVFGVPDERMGEELVAWIQVRAGAELDEQAVCDHCRDRIAHFKVPRYVQFVDEFPMTVTGKAQKFKMRDRAMADLGISGGPAGD